MAISADQVKTLRDATGAGMMDSKRALEATNGDIEKAKDWLRQKGIAKAGAKAARTAREGIIATYVHHNHQLGVLLELNSESDFVARNDEFRHLAHEIAVHIAAAEPKYLRREDVPQDVLDREALLQELRAPGDLDVEVRRGELADQLLDPVGSTHGYCRLSDHECLTGEMWHEGRDGGLDVTEVGPHAVVALRRADADEMDVAELGGLAVVGREAQPASGQIAA